MLKWIAQSTQLHWLGIKTVSLLPACERVQALIFSRKCLGHKTC